MKRSEIAKEKERLMKQRQQIMRDYDFLKEMEFVRKLTEENEQCIDRNKKMKQKLGIEDIEKYLDNVKQEPTKK